MAGALNLDMHGRDRRDIKEHWRALKGSRVAWSGKVHRASAGRHGYKILVKDPAVPTAVAYNIILTGEDRAAAKGIVDGDELRFEGVIRDYRPGKGERGTIVVLTDVRIVR